VTLHRSDEHTSHDMNVGIPLRMPAIDGVWGLRVVLDHIRTELLEIGKASRVPLVDVPNTELIVSYERFGKLCRYVKGATEKLENPLQAEVDRLRGLLTDAMEAPYHALLDKCGHAWWPAYEGPTCPICMVQAKVEALQARVRILEQALVFYANGENWYPGYPLDEQGWWNHSQAIMDSGYLARKTLVLPLWHFDPQT
jgi:hypothetical protein